MAEQLSEAAQLLVGVPQDENPPPQAEQEIAPIESANETDESQTPTDDDAPRETSELDLSKLLEKAGLDHEAWYALPVPGTDGMTFGQAKDKALEAGDLDEQKVKQASEHQDRENQVLEKLRQVAGIYEQLPEHARTPQMEQAITKLQEQYVSRETQLLMLALPEWKDEAVATTDREGIANLMLDYGYSAVEIQGTVDHRAIKMTNDFAKLKKMAGGIKLKEVRKGTKNAPGRHRAPVKPIKAGATEIGAILLAGLPKK